MDAVAALVSTTTHLVKECVRYCLLTLASCECSYLPCVCTLKELQAERLALPRTKLTGYTKLWHSWFRHAERRICPEPCGHSNSISSRHQGSAKRGMAWNAIPTAHDNTQFIHATQHTFLNRIGKCLTVVAYSSLPCIHGHSTAIGRKEWLLTMKPYPPACKEMPSKHPNFRAP